MYKDIGCFNIRCHWQMNNKVVWRTAVGSARLILTSQRAFGDCSIAWRIYWGDLSTVRVNTLHPYSVSASVEWISIPANVLLMLLWKAVRFYIVSISFMFMDFEHNSKTCSKSSAVETNRFWENIKNTFKTYIWWQYSINLSASESPWQPEMEASIKETSERSKGGKLNILVLPVGLSSCFGRFHQ